MRFIQSTQSIYLYPNTDYCTHTHTHTEYLVIFTRLFTVEFNSSVIKAFTSLKYTINGQNKGQLSAPWEP